MDRVAEELSGIKKVLENQNEIARNIFSLLSKPKSRFSSALKMVVLIVGALGILHTADVVRRWIAGG